MSTFKIRAGHHFHDAWPVSMLPWISKQSIERNVTFSPECAYDAPAYNEQDVNKLFGLSFGWGAYKTVGGPGYIPPVHWNSARFGWRWSKADQCIELLAYCYVNGKKNWDEQLRFPVVAQVKPGQQVHCHIEYVEYPNQSLFHFTVDNDDTDTLATVSVTAQAGLSSYGLTCGLYFGGSLSASHDMTVQIDRV